MEKNKLVFIFDEDKEVKDIPRVCIFDNEKDAEQHFIANGLSRINIIPNECSERFDAMTPLWKTTGKCYWAKHF